MATIVVPYNGNVKFDETPERSCCLYCKYTGQQTKIFTDMEFRTGRLTVHTVFIPGYRCPECNSVTVDHIVCDLVEEREYNIICEFHPDHLKDVDNYHNRWQT